MPTVVTEIARDAGSRKTIDGLFPVRVWQVQLDSPVNAAEAAIAAVNADPTLGADIGDAHPLDPFVFLSDLTADVTAASRIVWRVTGTYNESVGGLLQNASTPLDEPTLISWASNTYIEPVIKNTAGNAVTNSAGQAFDPPLTQERVTLIATITYNSETYDPLLPMQYQGKINDASTIIGTLTVPERMAKIIELSGTAQVFEDISYFKITIKVEINPKISLGSTGAVVAQGWDTEVLDQGLNELLPGPPEKLTEISLDDGSQVTEPVGLNGAGRKLAAGLDPVYLIYLTYEQVDFTPLNLEVV